MSPLVCDPSSLYYMLDSTGAVVSLCLHWSVIPLPSITCSTQLVLLPAFVSTGLGSLFPLLHARLNWSCCQPLSPLVWNPSSLYYMLDSTGAVVSLCPHWSGIPLPSITCLTQLELLPAFVSTGLESLFPLLHARLNWSCCQPLSPLVWDPSSLYYMFDSTGAVASLCPHWSGIPQGGLELKPQKVEHIFVAVITFSPLILCRYF